MRVDGERAPGLLPATRTVATPNQHRFIANAVADCTAETAAGADARGHAQMLRGYTIDEVV
jgi:hypothetical protein